MHDFRCYRSEVDKLGLVCEYPCIPARALKRCALSTAKLIRYILPRLSRFLLRDSDLPKHGPCGTSINQAQQYVLVAAAHDARVARGDRRSKSDGIQHIPDDGLLPACTVAVTEANKQFVTPSMSIPKCRYCNPAVLAFSGGTSSTDLTCGSCTRPVCASSPRLQSAGLVPLETLCAATGEPAKYHRLCDRGKVRVVNRADMVLLTQTYC
ncbi:hypothetical protein GGR57DRAFT_179517 [Xylariaceae sp. FL1272]|nr:hypothetical protein GGR57DRAFT_179517 [Xylariaceae sp. FL1272]